MFSAAASYFGVADLRKFAAETHDFESHYLDGLIGPLPGFEYVYAERSPAGHVTDATCPVLLLQGLDDPIVPPRQAESIAAELSAHGIRHALLTFKGESHGFRRAETIIAALEAELSFYGQVLGFTPPGIPQLPLTEPGKAAEAMAAQEGAGQEGAVRGPAGAGPAGAGGDGASQGRGRRPAGGRGGWAGREPGRDSRRPGQGSTATRPWAPASQPRWPTPRADRPLVSGRTRWRVIPGRP